MPITRTTTNSRNATKRGHGTYKKHNNNSGVNTTIKSSTKTSESMTLSSSLPSVTTAAKSHSTPTHAALSRASTSEDSNNVIFASSSVTSLSLVDQLSANKQIDMNSALMTVVKEFSDKLERMRSEFQRQVTELHELINHLLNKLDASQHVEKGTSELDIDLRLDAIEREKQMNDLVIDGIPVSEFTSDPSKAFRSLCASVDIDAPSYSEIFCIKDKNKNSASNDCGSIVVKLRENKGKHQVLNAIRAKFNKNSGHLSLRHIGVDSDVRIFVHEGLTKRNYKIFRETLKLKKKHHFANVYTYNGRVFLKVSGDSQPVYISCFKNLVEISTANAPVNQN